MGQCVSRPVEGAGERASAGSQEPIHRFKASGAENRGEPSKHNGFLEAAIGSLRTGAAASFTSTVSEGLAAEALGATLDAVLRDASGTAKPSSRKSSVSAAAPISPAAGTNKHAAAGRGAHGAANKEAGTNKKRHVRHCEPEAQQVLPPGAAASPRTSEAGQPEVSSHKVTPQQRTQDGGAAGVRADKRPLTRPKSRLNITTAPEDPAPPDAPSPPSPAPPQPSTPNTPGGESAFEPPTPNHPKPAAKGGQSEPGLWVLRRTGDVRSKYTLADPLGRGQFGIVCIATDKTDGSKWACKSVSKRRVQGMHDFSMADVLREVEVLYLVGGHPSVVGLREVYEDDEELHLVMELCQGGDWFERLITHGRYTEAEAAAVSRQVLEALSYCHSLGVMHRDIKPENIMFADRTEGAAVKLTDFGLAALFVEGEPLSEVLGSAYYVAPEVLRERYSKEADVWSTGVVLFIALGGYAPFDGANEREVFKKILYEPLSFTDPSWNDISAGAKEVISRMLTKDPKQRATTAELLAHPWLATCAGTLSATSPAMSPPMRSTPNGSVTMPASQPIPAAMAASLNAALGRKLPRGSIAAAVAAAVARGADVRTVPDAVVARLQQFAGMNAFKRQARRVLAAYLPEEEVVGLANIFRTMDTDGDGVLSMRELRQALATRGVHMNDKHAKLMLERTDLDGDGVIDYEEFLAATLHLARLERDERLWRAFRHFDTSGTGYITKDDLTTALSQLQAGIKFNVDKIVAEVDVDRDGRICYAEFCDMLRNQPEPALFEGAEGGENGQWGAWGEATDSGRLLLALPPDSRATTRNNSLANSRNTSSNDRTLASGRSIGRSMGGTSLYGESRFAPSRSNRPSNAGNRSIGAGSANTRPSLGGTCATSNASSVNSRFGSMRAAAAFATDTTLHAANENLQRAVLAQAAAAAAVAAVNQEQAAAASGTPGTSSSPMSPKRESARSSVVPEPTAEGPRVPCYTDPDRPVPRSALAQPSSRTTPTAAWPDDGGRGPTHHAPSVKEQGVRWQDAVEEEDEEVMIETPKSTTPAPKSRTSAPTVGKRPAADTTPQQPTLATRASADPSTTAGRNTITAVARTSPSGSAARAAALAAAATAVASILPVTSPARISPNAAQHQHQRTSPDAPGAAGMRPHPPPVPPPQSPTPGPSDRTSPAEAGQRNSAPAAQSSPAHAGDQEVDGGAPRRSPLAARRVHVVANESLGCTAAAAGALAAANAAAQQHHAKPQPHGAVQPSSHAGNAPYDPLMDDVARRTKSAI